MMPRPKGKLSNERDKYGWRVPGKGTLSRKIYDHFIRGRTPREIARSLQIDINLVRVLSHRFRNPDWRQKR